MDGLLFIMLHYTDNNLNKFMLQHSIDDVLTPVEGELLEYSCNEFTAFYGNGELILESDTETLRYVVDRIGFTPILVEY